MKAKELAEILLGRPDMDVAIAPFGGDNRWPVTRVSKQIRDESCDSDLLSKEFLQIECFENDIGRN